jgi:hypothetical protein
MKSGATPMMNDWDKTLAEIGISGPEEDNEFGSQDKEMEEAGMVLSSGFGNLYKYELSFKNKVMETKYAIPVIGKDRKTKVWTGDTPESVIKQFEYGVAKGGDAETTFTDIKQADKYLEVGHGSFKQERWHVTKLWDLGPVSKSAPPAQVSTSTITQAPAPATITAAQQAVEQGQTEQQEMAMEKAFSFTEFVKTGKNTIYIIAGVGVVIVIAGIAIFIASKSPAGQAGSAAGGAAGGLFKSLRKE